MATPRTDDELVQLLYRGGELLSGGKANEARPHLERALELAPKHEKAQNLLGLAYFKLGILDRACGLYEQLVRDNPTDPTLRVNLGLVYLKLQNLDDAVHEFEAATDLSPDHGKAHNYLGLTLAQMGDYARAREHFLLAGSDAMAEKMARALQSEVAEAQRSSLATAQEALAGNADQANEASGGVAALTEEVEQSASPHQVPSQSPDDELRFAEDEGPSAESLQASTPAEPLQREEARVAAAVESRGERRREAFALDDVPAEPEPSAPAALERKAQRSGREPSETISTSTLPVAPELSPPNEETFSFPTAAAAARTGPSLVAHFREVAPSLYSDAPRLGGGFVVGAELAMLPVQGELCARLSQMVATVGALEVKPAFRRVRGRKTTELLGGENAPFSRVSGVGRIWLWARGRGCVATKLTDESLYVREERLIAFEDSITYDNGRIPNAHGDNLPLVHLAGRGRVLLAVEGSLRTVEVLGDVPLSASLDYWVGWYGKLTPRVLAPSNGHGSAVELTGEGVVLLRLPAME